MMPIVDVYSAAVSESINLGSQTGTSNVSYDVVIRQNGGSFFAANISYYDLPPAALAAIRRFAVARIYERMRQRGQNPSGPTFPINFVGLDIAGVLTLEKELYHLMGDLITYGSIQAGNPAEPGHAGTTPPAPPAPHAPGH